MIIFSLTVLLKAEKDVGLIHVFNTQTIVTGRCDPNTMISKPLRMTIIFVQLLTRCVRVTLYLHISTFSLWL